VRADEKLTAFLELESMTLKGSVTPLLEIARMPVRFDHLASGIINANHSIMWATEKLCVPYCTIRLGVPQATKWQRIGD
jgi:hypothetical protein